jgi:two-component system phosphate regulon sensor histidine kinase PhoR
VRRVLLVNALIFAVLAAAVALAYYGYSYTSEVSSREREIIRDTMRDLAEEKLVNIEFPIVEADQKLFARIQQAPLSELRNLVNEHVQTTKVALKSVFVLDEQLKIVPDGYVSMRDRAPGIAFGDFFGTKVLPKLPLAALRPNERGHLYGIWDGGPYLFSFARRTAGDRVMYIVLEADLSYLVGTVFPKIFPFRAPVPSPRLYQVVDERGDLVYGAPFLDVSGGVVVELPFVDTVDGWTLRVAQRDAGNSAASTRRRIIDSLLIGLAVTVILTGLGFLTLAIRRERKANELKSEFISNVSHELKTPLSIISMFGEMLASGRTKSPEQATEYAEIIWRESVRLGRLIDNVLDFAKIERGMGVYEFAEGDVGEVVERAVELSARRVAAAEMTLVVDLAPALPPVRIDANAFTLAVLNLIDNAIKYAVDGKQIEVGLHQVGSRIELTVHDFGPGVAPEEHAHIFERFYRARAVRLKPIRGSGIGLALVQHIARAHHGDVTLESPPGEGATFRLWLPVADQPP